MAQRLSKRRRLELDDSASPSSPSPIPRVFPNDALAAATADDKKQWKGFCEIESEPAFFNVMLKQFGVKGVKVQEVVSLDDELLAYLPRPVYGLIFLFKWKEDDPIKQEPSCPPGVWFANQTVSNACASVALLNIVNNIPEVDLGTNLLHFKDFTKTLTPALRGNAISNFEFIKEIHNSFARKLDMLSGDLQLKNDVHAKKRKSKKVQEDLDETDASFHFIAFVPIEGTVWKLDGLERQPQSLGPIRRGEWLGLVKPDIEARMAEYEDGQIEFAILSLVKDPLLSLVASLAGNVKSLEVVSAYLDKAKPGWRDFIPSTTADDGHAIEGTLYGPDADYGLEQDTIDSADLAAGVQENLASEIPTDLLALRQELVTAQAGLRASIRDEQQSIRLDEEKAASRRHDYLSALQAWVRYHAKKSWIRAIMDEAEV
ncbi:hypothetical protein MMC24_004207 [Lignoscripta atroalba]|nr:hypothetical protein [Lignoscripta atroalba]